MKLSLKPVLLIALVAFAAAAIAGCGSSDKTSTSTTAAGSGATQTTTASTSGVTVATKNNDSLGTILSAGKKNTTVYLFEADKNGKSACDADCQAVWPPVTGKASVGPDAKSSELGTIKLSGGKEQVTYAGHPLYWYVKDTDSEDAYGQGIDSFGAEWYVLNAAGAKVEKGEKSESSSDDSAAASDSSGY
jgi:predicted lipoprotein with Yx(FWY)xxD motif